MSGYYHLENDNVKRCYELHLLNDTEYSSSTDSFLPPSISNTRYQQPMFNWSTNDFLGSSQHQYRHLNNHGFYELPAWLPPISGDPVASHAIPYVHSLEHQATEDKQYSQRQDIYQNAHNLNTPHNCSYLRNSNHNKESLPERESSRQKSYSTNEYIPLSPSPQFNNTTYQPLIEPNNSGQKRRKLLDNKSAVAKVLDNTQKSHKYNGDRRNKTAVPRNKPKDEDSDAAQPYGHKNGTEPTTRREDHSAKNETYTVNQIENELAFLRDECATILINLDSLRNAFHAEAPPVSPTNHKHNTFVTTMSFVLDDMADRMKEPSDEKKTKPVAHNPDIEREMRTAYDDLMLQVRQVERKIELLETKSKNVHAKKHIRHDKQ